MLSAPLCPGLFCMLEQQQCARHVNNINLSSVSSTVFILGIFVQRMCLWARFTLYQLILKQILRQFDNLYIFVYFFGGLECVGHSFAYVAHLFLRDVWIRTQRASIASRRATNLAINLPFSNLATHLPKLSNPCPKTQPPMSLQLSNPSLKSSII